MLNKKILFATTVRNPGKKFKKSVEKFYKIGQKFQEFEIIIVESDSLNRKYLKHFENQNNIVVKKLGRLKENIIDGHLRTERISFSRNEYIKHLKENPDKNFDYLIVFDSDGVSNLITYKKIKEALIIKNDWSAQFSNQLVYYYDIFALRSKDWVDKNYKLSRDEYIKNGMNPKKAILNSLTNKILHISSKKNLIRVESAFGGFGIYKVSRIGSAKYIGNFKGESICEHVPFNRAIDEAYPGTLYINPKLISGLGFPEHTFGPKILIKMIPSFIFNFLYQKYKQR